MITVNKVQVDDFRFSGWLKSFRSDRFLIQRVSMPVSRSLALSETPEPPPSHRLRFIIYGVRPVEASTGAMSF